MKLNLIPHPAFSLTSPLVTAREVFLAAACAGLKSMLMERQTHITKLEEDARAEHGADAAKIADLIRRNQELTKALHRQSASGHAALDVLAVIAFCAVIAAAILLCIADEPGLIR